MISIALLHEIGEQPISNHADSDDTFIFDFSTAFGADTIIDDGGDLKIDGAVLSGSLTPTTTANDNWPELTLAIAS